MKKCECGKKQYGYTDGRHEVFICFSCGKFVGHANGDAEFAAMVIMNPSSILGMIKEKYMRPHN